MKKLLLFLSLVSAMGFAQGNPFAAYMWNGSAWTPATSTATAQALTWSPPPASMYCWNTGLSQWVAADSSCFGGGGGPGTVTLFSAGTLSPLFTTSVATATTTPALSFALSNAAANTAFGNFTGSSGAPSYTATTGTGSPVAATSPTLVTPALGTPSALVITNATGVCTACTANAVPAANLTGATLASGVTASSLTSLGGGTVGTAAFVNTGTSGATVPLLNVANNTFSGLLIATNGVQVGSQTGFGTTGTGALRMGNTQLISYSSTAAYTGTADTILSRASAGVLEVNAGTAAGSTGSILAATYQAGILYSAAGTALPSCVTGLKGASAVVTDATSPTYLGTYTSGGAVVAAVLCNGTNWVTH